VLVSFSALVISVPNVAFDPLHPLTAGVALAVQLVALVEDQVSVVVCPAFTVVGLAENVTTGAFGVGAVTVTVADCCVVPPAPVHASM
jgi:hypothetical protein